MLMTETGRLIALLLFALAEACGLVLAGWYGSERVQKLAWAVAVVGALAVVWWV
jgi:hypothetical protein